MSHVTDSSTRFFRVEVRSVTSVADGVAELVLEDPHGRSLPEWEPGAHLDLHLPNGLIRQYSLTSSPADLTHYRIAVLREPDGRGGSEYIHTGLRPGDTLTCEGPRNNFSFLPAKAYRFIAGGIGITPLLQMIEHADRQGVPWKLSYFGRNAASMAWASDLQDRFGEHVEVRPDDVFGPPNLGQTLDGLIDGELIYACGPHGMLDALANTLGDETKPSLHIERFTADTDALTRDRGSFDVTLDRSGIDLHVPADKTILEVMEELGLPVISSCREGTCGTCETAILFGEADHRDSILSDEEKAENESMMICCSRGQGTRLVIDA